MEVTNTFKLVQSILNNINCQNQLNQLFQAWSVFDLGDFLATSGELLNPIDKRRLERACMYALPIADFGWQAPFQQEPPHYSAPEAGSYYNPIDLTQ